MYPDVLVGFHDLLDSRERQLVVLEEVHVLGHLVDLPLDLLELGLQALEIGLEVEHLLRTLLLLRLAAAFTLVEHLWLLILLSYICGVLGYRGRKGRGMEWWDYMLC